MSAPPERIQRLQQTALFGATSEDTVRYLLEHAAQRDVAPGEWFFHEGERGTSIYWLEEGRVAIRKRRGDKEIELRQLGPGDCFGEVALFDFGPRSTSVQAVQACRALEITSGLLREVSQRDLEQYTLLSLNLGREISRRLRSVEQRLFEAELVTDVDDAFHWM